MKLSCIIICKFEVCVSKIEILHELHVFSRCLCVYAIIHFFEHFNKRFYILGSIVSTNETKLTHQNMNNNNLFFILGKRSINRIANSLFFSTRTKTKLRGVAMPSRHLHERGKSSWKTDNINSLFSFLLIMYCIIFVLCLLARIIHWILSLIARDHNLVEIWHLYINLL